jgi:hypothetical protein
MLDIADPIGLAELPDAVFLLCPQMHKAFASLTHDQIRFLMNKAAPVETGQTLHDDTELIPRTAQNIDFFDKCAGRRQIAEVIFRAVVGMLTLEREAAAVFPDDIDARIDLGNELRMIFDRIRMKTELDVQLGILCKQRTCRIVDKIHNGFGNQLIADVGGLQLGKGLEINAVTAGIQVFPLIFCNNFIAQLMQGLLQE